MLLILAFSAVVRTCASTGSFACETVFDPRCSVLSSARPLVATQDSQQVATNFEISFGSKFIMSTAQLSAYTHLAVTAGLFANHFVFGGKQYNNTTDTFEFRPIEHHIVRIDNETSHALTNSRPM